jgi:hypothetical protein
MPDTASMAANVTHKRVPRAPTQRPLFEPGD